MNAAFLLTGVAALASAILMVTSRRVVHGVLWLGVMLASTAVAFALLDASFLAAIQLLIYVGGVMTLMVFGVMLTKASDGGEPRGASRAPLRGALVASVLFAIIGDAVVTAVELRRNASPTVDTAAIGRALLGSDLLAFEALSLLLLAAMIGAIVLARPKDSGATTGGVP